VQKIIREILVLLWKVFRLLLWKWLKPMLGRIIFYSVVLMSILALLVFIATRGG
jgi:hypothetical protein